MKIVWQPFSVRSSTEKLVCMYAERNDCFVISVLVKSTLDRAIHFLAISFVQCTMLLVLVTLSKTSSLCLQIWTRNYQLLTCLCGIPILCSSL